MEPVAWFMKAFKNYVGFEGRARRKEFWYFQLVAVIVALILAIVDGALGTPGASGIGGGLLGNLWSLVLLLPSIAVGMRRLHDTNKTGWWLLLALTGIGIIVLIVFWVQESDAETNQHGTNPLLDPAPTM